MEPRWTRAIPAGERSASCDPRETPIYNQLVREWAQRGRAMPGTRAEAAGPPAQRTGGWWSQPRRKR